MTPEFRGVPAAPNRCRIEAKVLHREQSPDFPEKWFYGIEILASEAIEGPNFARVGETVAAFTFDPPAELEPGVAISAEAEFLGDERGGQFQLTEIRLLDSDAG